MLMQARLCCVASCLHGQANSTRSSGSSAATVWHASMSNLAGQKISRVACEDHTLLAITVRTRQVYHKLRQKWHHQCPKKVSMQDMRALAVGVLTPVVASPRNGISGISRQQHQQHA